MSFFENFLKNLDAATFQADIATSPTDKLEDLFTNNDLKTRAFKYYNYWNEKEPMQDSLQIAQLKKILEDKFPTLFFRKARRFKVNVTVAKIQELVQLLNETNYSCLLTKFLKEFPADLVPKNISYLIINIVSKNQDDKQSAAIIQQLIEYYKIDNLSDVQNFFNQAQMRNFSHCANFFKSLMKTKYDQLSAIEIFLYHIKPSGELSPEDTTIFKEKISTLSLNEWRLIFKNITETNLQINKTSAFNFFKNECGFDCLSILNNQQYPIVGEFLFDWDSINNNKIELTGHQAMLLAVMVKHNNPAIKKSVITLVKEYYSNVLKDKTTWVDFIPKYPILWWGTERNVNTYQLTSMWKNIEYLKEVLPLLTIGKASELSLKLFNSKSATHTKLLNDFINDGAKEGKINWLKLGFLISINKIFDSTDDFQSFLTKLDENKVDDSTFLAYNLYLNPLEERHIEVIAAIKKFNKEAKLNILLSNANPSLMRDSLNMMMRIAKIHFDYTPKTNIKTWKEYHDFLIEENKKIKTKGIKLNQEELSPLLHGKVLAGLTCHVPQFSEELVAAGEHLGICVGTAGYDRQVSAKESNIIFFMNDVREIKYVIHFNDHRVIEAKGNSNHFLPGVRETLVKGFLKEHWWDNPKRTYKNSRYGGYHDNDHFGDPWDGGNFDGNEDDNGYYDDN